MKKQRNKLIDLKYAAFILLALVLTSCSFKDIFSWPVDRPATYHNTHTFNQSYDSLKLKTDKFIFNNLNIERYYNDYSGYGYNDGEYRKYKMMCITDTLYFRVIFVDKDAFSFLHLDFFRLQNIPFGTLEVTAKRKAIKGNKEI